MTERLDDSHPSYSSGPSGVVTVGGRDGTSERFGDAIPRRAHGLGDHEASQTSMIVPQPAASTPALKLPNRFRTVRSQGLVPAAVQEPSVGMVPCSSTNLRMASNASASRVASSVFHAQAGPLNTPGEFVLVGTWVRPRGLEPLTLPDLVDRLLA